MPGRFFLMGCNPFLFCLLGRLGDRASMGYNGLSSLFPSAVEEGPMRIRLMLVLLMAAVLVPGVRAGDEAKLIVKPEAFATLVNPNCSHCRDEAKRRAKELRDADRVLCWFRGYSDGGAIPFRFFLNAYPVISDSYGVFVHDRDAGFARGFAASYHFRFHGWRNGVMVMKHKDGTLYSCLSGVAFAGPKKGTKLKAVPTLVSTWGSWLKAYPHAVAYRMFPKYKAVELPPGPGTDSVKSRGPVEKRLRADTRVLGVVEGNHARAYPLDMEADGGLISERAAGHKRVIFWHRPTRTAAAYRQLAHPPAKKEGKPRAVT